LCYCCTIYNSQEIEPAWWMEQRYTEYIRYKENETMIFTSEQKKPILHVFPSIGFLDLNLYACICNCVCVCVCVCDANRKTDMRRDEKKEILLEGRGQGVQVIWGQRSQEVTQQEDIQTEHRRAAGRPVGSRQYGNAILKPITLYANLKK
jgi:hypothetical protein